jgi:hypothetical protein
VDADLTIMVKNDFYCFMVVGNKTNICEGYHLKAKAKMKDINLLNL